MLCPHLYYLGLPLFLFSSNLACSDLSGIIRSAIGNLVSKSKSLESLLNDFVIWICKWPCRINCFPLFSVALCCVVMFCSVMLHSAMLLYATHLMFCYAISCYVILPHVTQRYLMLRYAMQSHVILRYVVQCCCQRRRRKAIFRWHCSRFCSSF